MRASLTFGPSSEACPNEVRTKKWLTCEGRYWSSATIIISAQLSGCKSPLSPIPLQVRGSGWHNRVGWAVLGSRSAEPESGQLGHCRLIAHTRRSIATWQHQDIRYWFNWGNSLLNFCLQYTIRKTSRLLIHFMTFPSLCHPLFMNWSSYLRPLTLSDAETICRR